MRAGRYVRQPEGYRAFIPAPLPPNPPVVLDAEVTRLLSDADRALGRLDGATSILPNPDLFVAMYVRQEAVLSSQIEGTQSTLEDVLQFEIDAGGRDRPKDTEEVVNYVSAMRYGLSRLEELPLCLRLIREIHDRLLAGVRGGHRSPGEFRKSQNWIGPPGCTLSTAAFVPPPVHEMHQALHNFEGFLHDTASLPVLIHCGLAHAQFETIHPFLDGNGRVGRLLITFLLCQQEILNRPLLYLSYYLKAHRAEYYDRLTAIREDGNWEGWLKFFLRGVFEVSQAATATARDILDLREHHRQAIAQRIGGSANSLHLLDHLFEQPLTTIRLVQQSLNCSYDTAAKLVTQFQELGLLQESTGGKRNRRFRYEPYMALFESSSATVSPDNAAAIDTTESDSLP
jgi:Fic family protein